MASLYDAFQFFKQAWFSGRPTWNVSDIPDLAGRVVIVTGGTTGIGRAIVKTILEHNATVYIASRDQAKGEAVIQELKAETGKDALSLQLDLGDLISIRTTVADFARRETRLDILFNLAGVMMPPSEATTSADYDLSFGVNVLGHFFLTKLLLPLMIDTARTTGSAARVVHLSSNAHYLCPVIDFNGFSDGLVRSKLRDIDLYGISKWGNVALSNEMARRYSDKGIVSVSVNPGDLASLSPHVHSGYEYYVLKLMPVYPISRMVIPALFAGISPQGANCNGEYIVPWGHTATVREDARDPRIGRDLWAWCEEQIIGI